MGGLPVPVPAALDPLLLGPSPPGEPWADVLQTHTSAVLLLGDRAFKVKKPVRLPFVDLSTRAARRRDCTAEVRLNRRFSPDVYLGVLDLHPADGTRAAGEPVVAMRRMPAARRLSRLVAERRHDEALRCVEGVARRMAVVHEALPPLDDYPLRATMTTLWEQGAEQLRRLAGVLGEEAPEQLDEVARLAEEYLTGRAPLLDRRELLGLVRDGHGDLLADDVFLLDDGPRILDCLEFDPLLRHGDVLLDIAFLAMDLESLDAPDLARALLAAYRRYTGRTHPRSLEEHYLAYRAFVRCKVRCLRHEQGDPQAAARARLLLDLCRHHLHRGRVHLVLLGGLPGSGKSRLAADLARVDDTREWAVVGSDAVRKELDGIGPDTPCPDRFGEGLYAPERTARTYAELGRRAGLALAAGVDVALDASWTDAAQRAAIRRTAAEHRAAVTEIRCTAPDPVLRQRLAARTAPAAGSDAGTDVLDRMARLEAPWPSATTLRTDRPGSASTTALLALLDATSAGR